MPRNHQEPVIGGLVLAAGGSTRFGSPKQLLSCGEQNFVQRAVQTGIDSGVTPLVVVLGAGAPFVRPEVTQFPVQMIINRDWQEGVGSSIRLGLRALLQLAPTMRALVITTCDQPKVSAQHMEELVDVYLNQGKPIVSSCYEQDLRADAFGLPTLFDQSNFEALENLRDDEDPRNIIRERLPEAAFLYCPDGSFDIDTPADYDRYMAEMGAPA
ncbi:MAG: nucleotidyltransferase family protein [Catalinimonas sp.]